jgi:hypothetical protein
MTLYDTLPPQDLIEPPLLVQPGTAINAAYAHTTPGQLVAESQDGDQVQIRHTETDEVFTMPADMFQGQADREAEAAEALERRAALAVGPAAGKAAIIGLNEGAPVSPEESWKDKRRKQIFKPLDVYTKAEAVDEGENKYDFLFTASDEEIEERGKKYLAEKQAEQQDKYWPVTEKTKEDAIKVLDMVVANGRAGIRDVLRSFADKGVFSLGDSRAIVDAIRLNPDVRLAVGNLLLNRVDDMAYQLPTRVMENKGKSLTRNATGVSDLKSREVVALMALARIDGTFDVDSVRSTDKPDHARTGGQDSQGQHGQAMNAILGLPIQ